LCQKLALKIEKDNFKPDIVVAIARGGFVPSRIICDFLHINNLTSIKVQHYIGTERGQKATLKYPLNADIKNKNVLLVDDVNDTGKSIAVALEHLNSFGPSSIRTVVMHEKKGSVLQVDYFIEFLENWRWLIYQWAVVEDVGGFIENSGCKTVQAVLEMLHKDYGIHWSPADLKVIQPFLSVKLED
jgi:hypoxanthine phosphoribosyltransferase